MCACAQINAGADPNLRGSSNATPRDLAVRHGHTSVVNAFDQLRGHTLRLAIDDDAAAATAAASAPPPPPDDDDVPSPPASPTVAADSGARPPADLGTARVLQRPMLRNSKTACCSFSWCAQLRLPPLSKD